MSNLNYKWQIFRFHLESQFPSELQNSLEKKKNQIICYLKTQISTHIFFKEETCTMKCIVKLYMIFLIECQADRIYTMSITKDLAEINK